MVKMMMMMMMMMVMMMVMMMMMMMMVFANWLISLKYSPWSQKTS